MPTIIFQLDALGSLPMSATATCISCAAQHCLPSVEQLDLARVIADVAPGDPMPAGLCPRCRGLCYLDKQSTDNPVSKPTEILSADAATLREQLAGLQLRFERDRQAFQEAHAVLDSVGVPAGGVADRITQLAERRHATTVGERTAAPISAFKSLAEIEDAALAAQSATNLAGVVNDWREANRWMIAEGWSTDMINSNLAGMLFAAACVRLTRLKSDSARHCAALAADIRRDQAKRSTAGAS